MADDSIFEKKGEIGPRNYKQWVRAYPEPSDRAAEALRLVSTAKDLFFGIAEDNISVPAHAFDAEGNIDPRNARDIAKVWLNSRLALVIGQLGEAEKSVLAERINTAITGLNTELLSPVTAEMPPIKLAERIEEIVKAGSRQVKPIIEALSPSKNAALAKLAGAYVNRMEAFAERLISYNKKINLLDKQLKRHVEMQGEGKVPERDMQAEKTALKEKSVSTRRRIGEYTKIARALLPYVRLKGGKADLDQVLDAILGEVTKASVQDTDRVHTVEYDKEAGAMYQVDVLTQWMQGFTDRHPAFESCRPLVTRLGEQAKERLGMRREDPQRDAIEVELTDTYDALWAELNRVVSEQRFLRAEAGNIQQGMALIHTMMKQGEKPVTLNLTMMVEQAGHVNDMLAGLLQTLPEGLRKPAPELRQLAEATSKHLRHMLKYGRGGGAREHEFRVAVAQADAALGAVKHIGKGGEDRVAYELILRGTELLKAMPASLSNALAANARGQELDQKTLADAMHEVRQQGRAFIEEAAAFTDRARLRMQQQGGEKGR